MFVRNFMSTPVVTVPPTIEWQAAAALMALHHFRHLPVVSTEGRLLGILSERDTLRAAPSAFALASEGGVQPPEPSLQTGEIMSTHVLTVFPDTPVEEAARLMVDYKLGGLPVVDTEGHVVGIISETDIFHLFAELLGCDQTGIRVTLEVPDKLGVFASIATAISNLGAKIISIGTIAGDHPGTRKMIIKVQGTGSARLVERLEMLGDQVLDIRVV